MLFLMFFVPVELYSIFWAKNPGNTNLTKTLVKNLAAKNLAKNLVKHLAKNLVPKMKTTSGRSISDVFVNLLHPVIEIITGPDRKREDNELIRIDKGMKRNLLGEED